MSENLGPNRDSYFDVADDPICSLLRLEGASLSLSEVLAETLYAVRAHLGMEVAFISEFRGGSRVFRHIEGNFVPMQIAVGDSDPLEDSYCQRVLDGRLPELIHDASLLPEALRLPATEALPIGAHLSVPLRFSDGRLYGTFCCFSTAPDGSLDERDLTTMRLFANFAGQLLERHAQSELLHTEQSRRIQTVLRERAFSVVYQPIVYLLENRIVGYEALARFSAQPLRGPDLWFAEASSVGLGLALEVALIEEALKGLRFLPESVYMSLNVSPATVLSGALEQALAGQRLERLMLEVTEHESITDYGTIADALESLRKQGLRLAVDDAGAGYASFRHILRLKPDVIKLDGSLIRNIDADTNCRALASALVRFAEQTDSKVIAECIETEEELAVLRALKVNKAQGYLLGRPLAITAPVSTVYLDRSGPDSTSPA